jgi:hypothetical protein
MDYTYRQPPRLVFLKQESLAKEKYAKEGREKEVHVVVKNAPFILELALVNDPGTPHAYNVRGVSFETELCYDQDGPTELSRPVTFLKTPPIQCKVTVSDPVGGVVQLQLRLAALTSQHEDSFFCVHVFVHENLNGPRIPGVRLVSQPIKTVSKVDQIRSFRKARSKRKRTSSSSSSSHGPAYTGSKSNGTAASLQGADESVGMLRGMSSQMTRVESLLLEQQTLLKRICENNHHTLTSPLAHSLSSSIPSSSASASSNSLSDSGGVTGPGFSNALGNAIGVGQITTTHHPGVSSLADSASSPATSSSSAHKHSVSPSPTTASSSAATHTGQASPHTASSSTLHLLSSGLTGAVSEQQQQAQVHHQLPPPVEEEEDSAVALGRCFSALLEAFRRMTPADRPMAVRRIAKDTKPHDAGLVNEMLDMLSVEGSFVAPNPTPVLESHLPHHPHNLHNLHGMHNLHSMPPAPISFGDALGGQFSVEDLYAQLLNATQLDQ